MRRLVIIEQSKIKQCKHSVEEEAEISWEVSTKQKKLDYQHLEGSKGYTLILHL